MKQKIISISNITFIFLIALFLIIGLVKTIFFPKDINLYENRYSNKIIALNANTVKDNSFQNSVEDALADQILGAQTLKKLYNDLNSGFLSILVTPIIEANDSIYIDYKGSKLLGGRYVYVCRDMEKTKSHLELKAENYNKLINKYTNIDFFTYYIEKDTDINFETKEKINADDYFFSLLDLNKENTASFEIESFSDFKKSFYKTDHHWNHIGSYQAYKDLVELLDCPSSLIEPKNEVKIAENFMGSKAASVGSEFISEDFYAYEFTFPEMSYIVNGSAADDYGSQSEFITGSTNAKLTYGSFYGADSGEIIIDTSNKELDNILIIGESYDNALLKLIATHHNKTHSIDLRNYEHYFGKKFNFDEYVKENSIDKVLFIGNIDFYILDTFNLEID